ncbi:MAG: phenylalanine--tRNA ligase subunit beta [Patescibacteria group bacterium]
MNILASYSWIKDYLKTSASAEDFAREVTAKSFSVEHMTFLRDRYEHFVIGVVKSLAQHPNADRLQVLDVDLGGRTASIVCGGTNVAEGMKVVVALPGAKVRWHGEGELIELQKTEVRGVESEGMICAPSEMGFEKIACGPKEIWDVSAITEAASGTSFAEALDLDDTIMDIEVTSNRVDCMGVIGMAREGAVVLGEQLEWTAPALPVGGSGKELSVEVESPDLCPRYMAVVVDGVKVGPSPFWLQKRLLLLGERPINNIVDITNFVRLEYGQPMHAFDYNELAGHKIIVRPARDGEEFVALDETKHKLRTSHLVIADAEKAQAVAGVMGGLHSGTGESTTTIVFESATFDPISIRRTSRDLNLYSDSQLLFEKGMSVGSPEGALARALELTREIAGGELASEILDVKAGDSPLLHFPIDCKKIREVMGVEVDDRQIYEILEKLGFEIFQKNSEFFANVPYWRDHDIEEAIDLAEEVARIYGYHNIPAQLPSGSPPTTPGDSSLIWEDWTKLELRAAGFTELFSYSFVSQRALEKYDIDPMDAMRIYNPLSSDLTHLRTSLMPSLLEAVEFNEKSSAQALVFELSRIYPKRDHELPDERLELVMAEYGGETPETSFLKLKGVVEYLGSQTGLSFSFERLTDDPHWHPTRSAKILWDGKVVGALGEVDEAYLRAFGIDVSVVAAQLDWETLIPAMKKHQTYRPAASYPAVTRDLSFIVDEKLPFEDLSAGIRLACPMLDDLLLLDVYRGVGIADGKKSVTLSLALRAPDRTLSSEEVDGIFKTIGELLVNSFGAIMR